VGSATLQLAENLDHGGSKKEKIDTVFLKKILPGVALKCCINALSLLQTKTHFHK